MVAITPQRLLQAIETADAGLHPSQQAWIDEHAFGLSEVVLDGKFNFERIAELLNAPSKAD